MIRENGNWRLKRDHQYFYQVQIQMIVHAVYRCEFVVWSDSGISLESIALDNTFLDEVMINITNFFFKYGILPEILGKWYTRKPVADTEGIV